MVNEKMVQCEPYRVSNVKRMCVQSCLPMHSICRLEGMDLSKITKVGWGKMCVMKEDFNALDQLDSTSLPADLAGYSLTYRVTC